MNRLPKYVKKTGLNRIVCWKCRKTRDIEFDGKGHPVLKNKTLKNVRDPFGFKTKNYVCTDCESQLEEGQNPPNDNASILLVQPPQEDED